MESQFISQSFFVKIFIAVTKLSNIFNISINKSNYIKIHHLENKHEFTAIYYALKKNI